jgi:pimeloyl-ACP methyl ester carboxylesterase
MSQDKHDNLLREARNRALLNYAPGTKTRQVRWSGGKTEVLEAGDGPPLLLVHGGLGQASDWAPTMAQLARDFHVYAPDRPGHGLADPFHFSDFASQVLPHAVTFLSEIMDALGLDCAPVVGCSMGGGWVIELALRQPDRVSQVVLVGAPVGVIERLPPEFFEMRDLYRMVQRPVVGRLVRYMMTKSSARERARKSMAFLVARPEDLSDEMLDTGTFNIIRNGGGFWNALKDLQSEQAMPAQLVFGERLRSLGIPTTFLWGDRDPFCSPEPGRQACSLVPEGEFVLLADAGHMPWLDEPELVASEIAKAVLGPGRQHQRGRPRRPARQPLHRAALGSVKYEEVNRKG